MHVQSAVFQGQMSNSQTIFDLYQKTATIVPRFNVRLLNKKKDNSNQRSLESLKYINFNGYSMPVGLCMCNFLEKIVFIWSLFQLFIGE